MLSEELRCTASGKLARGLLRFSRGSEFKRRFTGMSFVVRAAPWRTEPGSCSAHETRHASGCKLRLEVTAEALALCLCWKRLERLGSVGGDGGYNRSTR